MRWQASNHVKIYWNKIYHQIRIVTRKSIYEFVWNQIVDALDLNNVTVYGNTVNATKQIHFFVVMQSHRLTTSSNQATRDSSRSDNNRTVVKLVVLYSNDNNNPNSKRVNLYQISVVGRNVNVKSHTDYFFNQIDVLIYFTHRVIHRGNHIVIHDVKSHTMLIWYVVHIDVDIVNSSRNIITMSRVTDVCTSKVFVNLEFILSSKYKAL